MTPDIRPATPADLEQVYEIWLEDEIAEAGSSSEAQPPREPLAVLGHELETGRMLVAEVKGRVVGFTALITRPPVHFLAEMFVRADMQSKGVGRKLLEQVLPQDGSTVCTLSSDDERALALYVRSGMQPQWPFFYLRANAADLTALSVPDIQVVEAEAGDQNLLNWDRGISGRKRPQEHDFWRKAAAAVPFWFKREDRTAGYGYVQMRSEEAVRYPEAATIGPIGGRTIEDARASVLAAVGWARERASVLRIGVPGPHSALAPLLEAGFRIADVDIFVCRGSGMFVDARRYVPSGGTLF